MRELTVVLRELFFGLRLLTLRVKILIFCEREITVVLRKLTLDLKLLIFGVEVIIFCGRLTVILRELIIALKVLT